MLGQRRPETKPRSFYEIDFVPTDGTRLPMLETATSAPRRFWAALSQAMHLTVYGTLHCLGIDGHVRFESKADICSAQADVR
jgi:hypothetical protein